MTNKELISYISTQKKLGKSDTEIKDALISGGGWSVSDIDEAIHTQDMKKKVAEKQKNDTFIFFGIVFLILVFLFFGLLFALNNASLGTLWNLSSNHMFSMI